MGDDPRIEKNKLFRVRVPEAPTARQLNQTDFFEDLEGSTEIITLSICKTGREVLHEIVEVGALCGVCHEPLCRLHSKNTCLLCGKAICHDDTKFERKGTEKFCITHNFLEKTLWRAKR